MTRYRATHFLVALAAVLSATCNKEDLLENADAGPDAGACTPGLAEGCAQGLVCEETSYGDPACFAPVVVRGRVFDLSTDAGIEGARVVARDANGAALGPVAVSGADGSYALTVPARRTDEQGTVEGAALTLRVDATSYQSYPGSFRPAMPIALSGAKGENELTIQNSSTDVGLIPLPGGASGLGAISGNVPGGKGALVVAEGGAALTGVADLEGGYTIFNVPAGAYGLRAYMGGAQYEPIQVDVPAGADVTHADFTASSAAPVTVSGSVNIVNAPGGSKTSVVLVVEATFNESFARGEVPPGLRAGDVTGAFEVSGVPDGKYVVLAAFENDGLVRDPDTSIAGTQIVHIEVSGAGKNIGTSFKVTEALAVKGPGADAPEAVSGTPTFSWADDSSEDAYRVVVYDSFGTLVWQDDSLGKVTGQQWVELAYGGPALEPGMIYQWRATSLKSGVPISMTEDLRGLFSLVP
ncbi:MAG: hypothetical protein PHU25_09365 [Deltaproteobacteria bacterium]|nr:hypothetical protein [Deltaproteobacteria bacterium]